MAEDKELDLAGIDEDAKAAKQTDEAAKQAPYHGQYTHTFSKPFLWRGKAWDTLTFDWETLNGGDYLQIEDELTTRGRMLVSPAFTSAFLSGMAARACTERDETGKRVLDGQAMRSMPIRDFRAITREAQNFFLRTE